MNKRPAILLISLLLAACSGQDRQALQQTLNETRNRPSGTIESLPEQHSRTRIRYTGSSQRSPFRLQIHNETAQPSGTQFAPDTDRQKTELEQYPLETLTLVGTLQFAGAPAPTALIDDGQGEIHQVKPGDYLGQDFGKVTAISEDTVFIEETVQDEQGGWVTRPRELTLAVNTTDE